MFRYSCCNRRQTCPEPAASGSGQQAGLQSLQHCSSAVTVDANAGSLRIRLIALQTQGSTALGAAEHAARLKSCSVMPIGVHSQHPHTSVGSSRELDHQKDPFRAVVFAPRHCLEPGGCWAAR